MSRYLKTALILSAICAVSAIILAVMNSVTAPYIESYEQAKATSALEEVAKGMEIGEREEVGMAYITYRHKLTTSGRVTGYILGLTSNGYGGAMDMVASYDISGKAMAAKLVSDSETPGVGKKAENPGYMDKFIGIEPIPTNKGMLSEADSLAVSGASITFTGISKAMAYGSDYVKSL